MYKTYWSLTTNLSGIILQSPMRKLPGPIPVFWLFTKLFDDIMAFIMTIIILNVAQIYISISMFLNNTSVNLVDEILKIRLEDF